ncbi:transcription elongation factor TFIIS-like protein, partial [Tanacetum coccineum]
LTKHPKKKIQSLASELVEIWKGVIVEETIKNKKNGNLDIMESPKSNNTPVMSQNKVHRDNSIKAARKEEIKVENKPTINDVAPLKLTSLVYCKDPIRDKIHELLAEALRKILLGHVKPERIVESTPKEITSTERQMENVKIKEKALFDCERGAHQRLLLISLDVGDDIGLLARLGDYPCLYVREAIVVVRDSILSLKDLVSSLRSFVAFLLNLYALLYCCQKVKVTILPTRLSMGRLDSKGTMAVGVSGGGGNCGDRDGDGCG